MLKRVIAGVAVAVVLAGAALCAASPAAAQVSIDAADYERARKAAGDILLSDLSVNDTAVLGANFCITDGKLYLPGWAKPADLANEESARTGIMLRVTVLPGKRLKVVFVDAAQAQAVAKGNAAAPAGFLRDKVARLFIGGPLFGTVTCEQEQTANPLRELIPYEVESLNGAHSISELLKSVGG